MRDRAACACVTRRRRRAWSGPCGGDLDDLLGEGEVEPGVEVDLRLGGVGALAEGPGGGGGGGGVGAVEGGARVGAGGAGAGVGDAGEQEREPAQHDVGADALFEAVVDRAQVEDLFHVPPAALDLEELLVAQGDVGGRQVRVRAAQQVLPVQVRLGLDPVLVDAQQPAGGDPQVPVQAGLGADLPRSSPRFITGSVSDPAICSSSWATNCSRTWASRSAASGLWQITNRSVSEIFTSLTRMFSPMSV